MLSVTSTDLQCNYSNNWFQWNEVLHLFMIICTFTQLSLI